MTEIIEAIQGFAPIAHWTIFGTDDASPPIVAWTFAEPPEDAAPLHEAVDAFEGTLAWELRCAIELRPDGKRWTLMPARVREYANTQGCRGAVDAATEIKRHDPQFSARANAELRQLAAHLHFVLTKRATKRAG